MSEHINLPVVAMVGGEPHAVFCGHCKSGAWLVSTYGVDGAWDEASRCCGPMPCKTCGVEMRPRRWCSACSKADERKRIHDAFAKATKTPVEEYAGEMVVGDGDEDYHHTDEWDAAIPFVLDDGTRFLRGTTEMRAGVCLADEASGWLEEHHEDAHEQIDPVWLGRAQEAIDEALKDVVTFYPDETTALILPAVAT